MIRERLVRIVEHLAPTPVAWFAIIVGVFVHFVGFFLFKVEVPTFSEFRPPEADVSYVSLDQESGNFLIRERALLSDSVPLFLPSEFDYNWNRMQPSYYADDRAASLFVPFDYNVRIPVDSVISDPFADRLQPEPIDLFESGIWRVFHTLGESGDEPVRLPERFGVFQFIREADRQRVTEVPVQDNPVGESSAELFWKPAEILVTITETGCMGNPLVRESSGIVAIDQFAADWVERYANSGRVAPGYYRVIFGP